jgi:uncharacterized repeat protein (TIGR02543 family)
MRKTTRMTRFFKWQAKAYILVALLFLFKIQLFAYTSVDDEDLSKWSPHATLSTDKVIAGNSSIKWENLSTNETMTCFDVPDTLGFKKTMSFWMYCDNPTQAQVAVFLQTSSNTDITVYPASGFYVWLKLDWKGWKKWEFSGSHFRPCNDASAYHDGYHTTIQNVQMLRFDTDNDAAYGAEARRNFLDGQEANTDGRRDNVTLYIDDIRFDNTPVRPTVNHSHPGGSITQDMITTARNEFNAGNSSYISAVNDLGKYADRSYDKTIRFPEFADSCGTPDSYGYKIQTPFNDYYIWGLLGDDAEDALRCAMAYALDLSDPFPNTDHTRAEFRDKALDILNQWALVREYAGHNGDDIRGGGLELSSRGSKLFLAAELMWNCPEWTQAEKDRFLYFATEAAWPTLSTVIYRSTSNWGWQAIYTQFLINHLADRSHDYDVMHFKNYINIAVAGPLHGSDFNGGQNQLFDAGGLPKEIERDYQSVHYTGWALRGGTGACEILAHDMGLNMYDYISLNGDATMRNAIVDFYWQYGKNNSTQNTWINYPDQQSESHLEYDLVEGMGYIFDNQEMLDYTNYSMAQGGLGFYGVHIFRPHSITSQNLSVPDSNHADILAGSTITYELTTSATNGLVSPFSGTYDENTQVELTASPNSGYQFDNWSGDASGTTNPITINMDGNKSITANFSVLSTQDTIYIDPTAGSGGDGSYGNPYDSWNDVTWEAGKIYLQKRGTEYNATIDVGASGTSDNWITIGAYGTGDKPKISTNDNLGFELGNISYIKIQDFQITTTGTQEYWHNSGIKGNNGSYNTFENLDIGPSAGHGLYVQDKSNVLVSGCYFFDCGTKSLNESCDNIHLENCTDYIVEYCESRDCHQGAVYDASDGGSGYTSGIFRYNIGYRTDTPDEWSIFKMSGQHSSSSVELLHNIAFDCFKGPAYALQETLTATMYGNIAYNCVAGIQNAHSNNVIKNNIFMECNDVIYLPDGDKPSQMDHNLFYNNSRFGFISGGQTFPTLSDWKTWSGLDQNSSAQNPLFTDAANYDFTLQSGSPAIDAGANIGSPYDLIVDPSSSWTENVSLVNQGNYGTGWEIGVFAFTGGTITYTLSTSATNGSVSPSGGTYDAGTNVDLTASPNSGYQFDEWSGDISGAQNPITVTMDSNINVTANFSQVNQTLIAESGLVSDVSSSGWTTVQLSKSFNSMVVVAVPNYGSGSNPGVARVRNASGSSFEVKIDEAGGGSLSGVDVHYLVVEEGTYSSPKMEAIKVLSDGTNSSSNWSSSDMEQITYQNTYTSPVVFGQVMTANDPDWSVFWACDGNPLDPPSASACYVGKNVSGDTDVTRSNETLGVIIIESGSGTIDGLDYLAALGDDGEVRGFDDTPPYSYSYTGPTDANVAVLSTSGMDGADGGWPILYGTDPVSSSAVNLAFDEDQIGDSERAHTTEQVAYMVLAAPEQAQMDTVWYQAEDGNFISGTSVDSDHSGYTGTGFVNTPNQLNAWNEFVVSVSEAGNYDAWIRYANGSSIDRSVKVLVNSTEQVSSLSLVTTGDWTNWQYQNLTLSLDGSADTVRLVALTSRGNPNIDRLDIYQDTSILKSATISTSFASHKIQKASIFVYPNPVMNDVFYVNLNNIEDGYSNSLNIFDITGRLIYRKNIAGTDNVIPVHTEDRLKNGIYVITVENGSGFLLKEMLIIK